MVTITLRARHTRMLAATLYLCDYSLQYVNVWHLFELFLIICSWYTVQEFAVSLFSLLSFLLKKRKKKKDKVFFLFCSAQTGLELTLYLRLTSRLHCQSPRINDCAPMPAY